MAKTIKMRVTLSHKEHGKLTTVVDCPAETDYCNHYASMAREAKRNAASRFVDYNSFKSESDYMNRIDAVQEEFFVLDMEIDAPDSKKKRYVFDAHYEEDEEGPFTDWFYGFNAEEAEFNGLQTMAENCGFDREEDGDDESFQGYMQGMRVHYCQPQPITLDEAKDLLKNLTKEARRSYRKQKVMGQYPALAAAEKALKSMGVKL